MKLRLTHEQLWCLNNFVHCSSFCERKRLLQKIHTGGITLVSSELGEFLGGFDHFLYNGLFMYCICMVSDLKLDGQLRVKSLAIFIVFCTFLDEIISVPLSNHVWKDWTVSEVLLPSSGQKWYEFVLVG